MNTCLPKTVHFNSQFSLRPLINAWEAAIADGRQGVGKLYDSLLQKVRQHPELLVPITDDSIIDKHKGLIEEMMATVFPVTLSHKTDLFAIGQPFQQKVIYASSMFHELFVDQESRLIRMPEMQDAEKLETEKFGGAYQLILDRLYGIKVDGTITSVHALKDPATGLDQYMELELDTRFIDVVSKKPVGPLPEQVTHCTCKVAEVCNIPGIRTSLPLEDFYFEGFVIIRLREVTEREIISKIKNSLLNIHSFSDNEVFVELQNEIRNLLGTQGVHTAVKPFFKVNDHLVLTEVMASSSIVKQDKSIPAERKYEIYKEILSTFNKSRNVIVVDELDENAIARHPFLSLLREKGFRNAIVCPLFSDKKELLGVLIIASDTPGTLKQEHAAKMVHVLPLFSLAIEKSQEHLDHQVDKVIKEQFTAVQDAVEWRFTEAALNYLTRKDVGEQVKIEPIYFDQVYPLYGAIDIRNSSVERNNAIQLDMLEQLALANQIVEKARSIGAFPLLEEIQFKLERFTHAVTNILFAEEELAIHHFLVDELVQLFRHLRIIMPELSPDIEGYMQAIDSPVKMIYHHRKAYEESITRINNEVAKLIDQEQKSAQEIYPHYFERFVTDGLDFNIYIGQSISPHMPFDSFYLKNLKIWQLTTLVKAAQLTARLQEQLPLGLQTTQLILAHSQPISISFRTAERKFDVDGAYNIRYEIIKKRIDKVHIRDSHERLTKPGTISIVYSQPKEAEEYLGYIEFLQNKGLLHEEIERYDLEELQGVVGLRGLRVSVNTDAAATVSPMKVSAAPVTQLSTVTTADLTTARETVSEHR